MVALADSDEHGDEVVAWHVLVIKGCLAEPHRKWIARRLVYVCIYVHEALKVHDHTRGERNTGKLHSQGKISALPVGPAEPGDNNG